MVISRHKMVLRLRLALLLRGSGPLCLAKT